MIDFSHINRQKKVFLKRMKEQPNKSLLQATSYSWLLFGVFTGVLSIQIARAIITTDGSFAIDWLRLISSILALALLVKFASYIMSFLVPFWERHYQSINENENEDEKEGDNDAIIE